jgi:hypothetical protein
VEIQYGDEVLDTVTGKSGIATGGVMLVREQVAWLVYTGKRLGRLEEKFRIPIPVDGERYRVIKAAPRRNPHPGSAFISLALAQKAYGALAGIQPGQMIMNGDDELGTYLRRHEGGYMVITSDGQEFRYEAWELGEMAAEGKLRLKPR